jgi:hypothetical protein
MYGIINILDWPIIVILNCYIQCPDYGTVDFTWIWTFTITRTCGNLEADFLRTKFLTKWPILVWSNLVFILIH